MPKTYEGQLSGEGRKFGVVISRFNDFIGGRLLDGALDALARHGTKDKDIDIVKVPGAFEIPLVAKKLAEKDRYDAIICLGAVIRGSTPHFDYICSEAAKGIGMVSLNLGIPVIFGIITSDTLEQAIERAGSKAGNKGWDAAVAAMEMANVISRIEEIK